MTPFEYDALEQFSCPKCDDGLIDIHAKMSGHKFEGIKISPCNSCGHIAEAEVPNL